MWKISNPFKSKELNTVTPTKIVDKPKTGRVVQRKSQPEYEPNISTRGGRVVRAIPKNLKKIKDAQNGVPKL